MPNLNTFRIKQHPNRATRTGQITHQLIAVIVIPRSAKAKLTRGLSLNNNLNPSKRMRLIREKTDIHTIGTPRETNLLADLPGRKPKLMKPIPHGRLMSKIHLRAAAHHTT